MNQLTYTTIRQLPEINVNTVDLQQRELSVEFWKQMYADAGAKSKLAWDVYNDAVDDAQCRTVIDSTFETAQMYDDICRGAWVELEKAKQNLLALYN